MSIPDDLPTFVPEPADPDPAADVDPAKVLHVGREALQGLRVTPPAMHAWWTDEDPLAETVAVEEAATHLGRDAAELNAEIDRGRLLTVEGKLPLFQLSALDDDGLELMRTLLETLRE